MSAIAPSRRPPPPAAADPLPPLVAGERLDQPTFHARYAAMPPSTRAELVGGVVHMPSPVRRQHGLPHAILAAWVTTYMAKTPGAEAMNDMTAILGRDGEPQPDAGLRVVSGGQTRVTADDYVQGCPELVCEVAASSAAVDLGAKLRDYDRYGAGEYVVAVVADVVVRWFRRDADGRLAEVPPDADGVHRSTAFPGLWLDPDALLRGDAARVLDVLTVGLATAEHAAFAADLVRRTA